MGDPGKQCEVMTNKFTRPLSIYTCLVSVTTTAEKYKLDFIYVSILEYLGRDSL